MHDFGEDGSLRLAQERMLKELDDNSISFKPQSCARFEGQK